MKTYEVTVRAPHNGFVYWKISPMAGSPQMAADMAINEIHQTGGTWPAKVDVEKAKAEVVSVCLAEEKEEK
jgi:hypothetical protein